ncbi:MAG: hypothetical protein COA64_15265 [Henriciella sp.]|nr:MAG: hypothetical protein COA64_15265 [Henriciella sp.]
MRRHGRKQTPMPGQACSRRWKSAPSNGCLAAESRTEDAGMRKFVSGNLNYSSWSIRALLMVRHLKLDVEEEIVPLDFPDTTARLAEISPTRKVPLLLWDDETVWDSLAIIEWLADRFPDAGV